MNKEEHSSLALQMNQLLEGCDYVLIWNDNGTVKGHALFSTKKDLEKLKNYFDKHLASVLNDIEGHA